MPKHSYKNFILSFSLFLGSMTNNSMASVFSPPSMDPMGMNAFGGSSNMYGGIGPSMTSNPMGMGSGMGTNGGPSPDLSQISHEISQSLQNVMGKGLDGIYVGLGAGYATFNGTYYKGAPAIGQDPIGLKKLSDGGIQLALYGGYGLTVEQRFYLGGEAEVGYNTVKSRPIKFSQGVNFGISGRAGPVFSNKYLAYFKLGVNATNYRWSPWGKSLNFFGFDVAPGLGFEMMLGTRGTLRFEGSYGIAVGKANVTQNANATWKKLPNKFKIFVGMALKV